MISYNNSNNTIESQNESRTVIMFLNLTHGKKCFKRITLTNHAMNILVLVNNQGSVIYCVGVY